VKAVVAASALLLFGACEAALNKPSPISAYAPGRAQGRSADQLIAEGNTAWTQRAEPRRADIAQGLYLDAAVADPRRVEGLLGAMQALSYRIEFEPGVDRNRLAQEAVELGQWCQRQAPGNAACGYRLAIALGQLARERTSVGKDAMNHMVELLHGAIATAPHIDDGGPHRVLALLLLRAPGWPVGPGDTEAGLAEARLAVQIAPNAPANQLVLAEALVANDRDAEARAAYGRAAALASARHDRRDPEVARWLADARSGIARTGG
jgi:hypothetical protein